MSNAANVKEISSKRQRQKSDEETERLVLRTLMGTVEGRRYIWLRLWECHVFASTFTGEALKSAFLEGERNVGLQLYGKVAAACPNECIRMTIENSAVELKTTENEDGRNVSASAESDSSADE